MSDNDKKPPPVPPQKVEPKAPPPRLIRDSVIEKIPKK